MKEKRIKFARNVLRICWTDNGIYQRNGHLDALSEKLGFGKSHEKPFFILTIGVSGMKVNKQFTEKNVQIQAKPATFFALCVEACSTYEIAKLQYAD